MPITYPLTTIHQLPGFQEFSWEPESNVGFQENPFTFSQKVYAWTGQRRKATASVRPLVSLDEAREWQTFLYKLNGREGTFLMQDQENDHTGNFDLGGLFTPRVKGGGQNGVTLETDGWEPGMVDVLKKGDWISLAYRLHMVLDDVSADTAGEADIDIWPHVRENVEDNQEVAVGEQAWGTFRLLDFPAFVGDLDVYMKGFKLGCVEAF